MDCLTFLSNTIGHLAWPVSVVVMVLLLKDNLGDLLPRLEKFKHKDTEIAFSKFVKSVEDKAEASMSAANMLPPDLKEEHLRLDKKIKFAPHPSINQAYSILERELLEFYEKTLPKKRKGVLSIREAREHRLSYGSNENLENNIRELRKIRNYIMENKRFDDNDLTLNQVESYIGLALDCTMKVRALSANKTPKPPR